MIIINRKKCRLCDSPNLELVIPLKPTPIAESYVTAKQINENQEKYPLDLFLCNNCGHLQMLDIVDPEVMFGNYTYLTASSLGLVEHFKKGAEKLLEQLKPEKNLLMVEIGSNDGSLLRFYKDKGMQVLGIDPAREIAKKATESGTETLPKYFTSELARDIKKNKGMAKIIVANNVFAHADDLGDMAEGVRELLSQDGIFVFEVSYIVDIVQKMLFDTVYHEHLSYHSVKPLKSFFNKHGMELIDIERIPTKGGSIRGFAQLIGGNRPVSPSVFELIKLEEDLKIDKPETFKSYYSKIEEAKEKLNNTLNDLKIEGKKIAGYGSSHTVNTLMHHFELGNLIEFIIDDNSFKHGLFTPGHHIPIFSSEAIYEKKPDYIVILAWNYAKPIMEKHQEYKNLGGKFIIPLPELRIV